MEERRRKELDEEKERFYKELGIYKIISS